MGESDPFNKLMLVFAAAVALVFALPIHNGNSDTPLPETDPVTEEVQDLSTIFNRAALENNYSRSCEEKSGMRAGQVEPPSQESTPDAFQQRLTRTTYYSPSLTDEHRAEAATISASMEDFQENLFFMHGGTWVFTEHSLVEALPEYDDVVKTDPSTGDITSYPYYEDYVGLYRNHERRLYVTFSIGDVTTSQEDGTIVKSIAFRDVAAPAQSTADHEYGHFLDHIIGTYYLQGSAENADRFSSTDLFQQAYLEDVAHIIAGGYSTSDISYYLPTHFANEAAGGDHEDIGRARKEAFAELWSEATGTGDQSIQNRFPRSFALTQEIQNILQDSHQENATQCIFTEGGIAFNAPSI